jgi:hypothetical protein
MYRIANQGSALKLSSNPRTVPGAAVGDCLAESSVTLGTFSLQHQSISTELPLLA